MTSTSGPDHDRQGHRTMSRTATRDLKLESTRPPRPAVAEAKKESFREFVEQIVVAFILAMLIRGFDAEAFVIPTGSMAPTLMGRHKEVVCPQCGHQYAINASDETEKFIVDRKLGEMGICGNCRFRTPVDDTPSFKGDRILVMKFPYELPFLPASSGPKRWDVVVFHYPENPETNYIKRLVGLPGEELRINHGDIQARPRGDNAAFAIERKPLYHQKAMQMLVYDDAHRAKLLADKPEWRRWQGGSAWKEEAAGTYATASAPGSAWSDLRYRHLVPDPEQWAAAEKSDPMPRGPRPTLITDFYSYNTNISTSYYDRWLQEHEGWLQLNWVGDLTVSCRVDVTSASPGAKARFELIEAGIANRCEVDLATGVASIFHGDQKLGEAPTSLKGQGARDVTFANVDDRLTLWVDGSTPFGEGLPFEDPPTTPYAPTARDLDPVGVAFQGASGRVSDLVLKRDIYYTQDPRDPDYKISGVYESIDREDQREYGRVLKMFDFLADPTKFPTLETHAPQKAYVIRPDHFMMMGDNSPRSSDSRAWSSNDSNWGVEDRSSWEVPRTMLVGKAFFVYWPHGKPFGPDVRLSRDFRLPFRPYFERMKWIR